MPHSLTQHSLSAVFWTLLRVLGQSGIGVAVGIILGRLLPVADFGVMAIAMLFISLAELLSTLGLGTALIQRRQLRRTHIDIAMTLSLLMATVFSALYWWAAPWAAAFFHEPRLTEVIRCLVIGQWFSTLTMVPRGLLRRRLQFKRLFQIELGSYLLGYALLSVVLAWSGMGLWSLIIGTCAWFFLACIASFRHAKITFRLSLRRKETWELLSFGLGIGGKSLLDFVGTQSASFLAGRFLDAFHLGLYWRASQVADLPLQKIAVTFSSAMFPIYARLQDDLPRLERAYLRTVASVALLSLPPLAGAAAAPEWVIVGLYGDQWRDAAPVFSLLCLAAMLNNILHLAGAVVEATGHINAEIWRQGVKVVILVAGYLLAAAYYHDITLMAGINLLGSLWLYIAMAALTLRILDSRWRRYLAAQAGGIAIAGITASTTFVGVQTLDRLGPLPAEAGLAALIAWNGAVYLLCLALLPDRYTYGAKRLILEKLRHRKANHEEMAH